jgi:hypothetical protein
MNVLNDEDALHNALPIIEFGYSRPDLLLGSGYVAISGEHKEEMIRRLRQAPYHDDHDYADSAGNYKSLWVLIGTVISVIFAFVG